MKFSEMKSLTNKTSIKNYTLVNMVELRFRNNDSNIVFFLEFNFFFEV